MNLAGICIVTFFLFAITSCKHSQGVDYVFQQAGSNRIELEKVLVHYQNDSLKYKAACFLIENMLGHFSYQSPAMDYCKQKLVELPYSFRRDSMNRIWKQAAATYSGETLTKVEDYKSIKSSFLIENIDQAFRAWEKAPWYKEVDFQSFCRYILPYRISDEQLSDDIHWRDSLAQRYGKCIQEETDMKRAFTSLLEMFDATWKSLKSKCPYKLDVLTIDEGGFSLCEQRCVVRGNVMRSLGIPVVCDYVNSWANYSHNGHSWISLIGEGEKAYLYSKGDSIPRTSNPIDASFFKPLVLPDTAYAYWVDSLKRTVKVYRRNFFRENEKDNLVVDVSKCYGLTDSVEIQTDDAAEKYVYLCTFRTGEDWRITVKNEIVDGRCMFRNLGASIVYLPALLKEENITALDAPFILYKGGEVRKIIPTGNKQTVRLSRKYILMTTWTNRWYQMIGGRFEASNDIGFHHADVLCQISSLPVYRNEVRFNKSKSYRYVRYVSPGVLRSELSELTFFSGKQELKGKEIGEGIKVSAQKRVFDHNLTTIGDSKTIDYWVGLDLGKKCFIDKLVYYPRNDDNFIVPGEQYELFYYDKGSWHSLGTKIAESEELIYEQVPEGALFLLKNRTKGQEERIFTYENGRQVWW